MIAGLTINRKLHLFPFRSRLARRLRILAPILLLLSLAPLLSGSIAIPELPKEKRPDKKKGVPNPPQAVPAAAQVINGGTVQVALRIYGRQEQETTFLVRKAPTLGKVVSLTPLQNEKEIAVLTYQHTSDMKGEARLQDRISFVAQNANGTSAPAELVITIVDNPPELDSQSAVEFGEIAAGIPSTQTLTVTNKGGGTLTGTVEADAPWTIEPTSFSLRRDEKALLRLTLLPDADREYQGRLHFSGESQLQPVLHAVAYAPFQLFPAKLELEGDSVRSGTFTLTNRTAAELTVSVTAHPRLHLPAQLVLPPKGTQTVAATLAAQDVDGYEGSVRFSIGSVLRQTQVHARGTAPQLRAEPTELAFGKLESGVAKTLKFKLANRGGSAARIDLRVPAPFRADPGRVEVASGQSVEISISLESATPGPVSGVLSLGGANPAVEIPLSGEITPRKMSDTPPPASSPGGSLTASPPPKASYKTQTAPDVDPAALIAAFTNASGNSDDLPRSIRVQIKRVTSTGIAEFTWPPPTEARGDLNYQVEVRRLSLESGKLEQFWIPVPNVTFTKKPECVTALVTGIPPGITRTVRIVASRAQGDACAASQSFQLSIPKPVSLFTVRNGLLAGFSLLLAGGLAALGREKWKARQGS